MINLIFTSHPLLFLDALGTGEFILIMLAIFLLFGPEKMPEITRKLGRIMNEMKKASNDITREFNKHTEPIRNEFNSAKEEITKRANELQSEIVSTKEKVTESINSEVIGIERDINLTPDNPEAKQSTSTDNNIAG